MTANCLLALCIDFRSEDGHFPVHLPLSSSETWVDSGMRSWKRTYVNELEVKKPFLSLNPFHKEMKRCDFAT
jgi:hypothetical protein